jgi:hypothetical protein
MRFVALSRWVAVALLASRWSYSAHAQEPSPAPELSAPAAVVAPSTASSSPEAVLTPVPGGGGADYEASRQATELSRELRSVEQEIDGLKERVFRSKATLQLLRELVLEGKNTGSRVQLWHVNKMGPAYVLESAQYYLDGKNVYSRVDNSGALDREQELELVQQALPPGTHNLQVSFVLRGNGLGVFSYLDAYSFKVQSSYSFTVEEGRATQLRVILNESGGPLKAFVDRPSIDYEEATESQQETE